VITDTEGIVMEGLSERVVMWSRYVSTPILFAFHLFSKMAQNINLRKSKLQEKWGIIIIN
jgi:hypothetical protein